MKNADKRKVLGGIAVIVTIVVIASFFIQGDENEEEIEQTQTQTTSQEQPEAQENPEEDQQQEPEPVEETPLNKKDTTSEPASVETIKMGIKGLDRWGGDVENLPNTDLDTCKQKCIENADCIGISHNVDQNHCFVKGYPGKTTNQMKNPAPNGSWQWYYRTDKPYSNSNMSVGWYNTAAERGTHVNGMGAGFEWNKNMTWEGCAEKAKELGYTAFGFRNSNDKHGNPNTCFFEKEPFNPYDGSAPLSNQEDNAYAMACADPKKTITSGCRTEQASDDTKVLAGYNLGGHHNKDPWSENSGTMEDCRINAINHGYIGYGYRTDMHPDKNWKQKCYYFTQGDINQKPDWKGNPADTAHVQGCVDPSKDWPNCS